MKLWKKIAIGIGILVIIAAIATPSYFLLRQRQDNNNNAVVQSILTRFGQQYNGEQVLLIQPPKTQYEIISQDKYYRYMTLYMDGALVRVLQVPISSGNVTSP